MYEKIDAICKEKGSSIYQLEKELGLGGGTISKWKTSSPKVDTASKVAKALGVTLDYLVSDEKEPTAEIDDGLREIVSIFKDLTPDNRSKLLELSHLFLDAQHKTEEKK